MFNVTNHWPHQIDECRGHHDTEQSLWNINVPSTDCLTKFRVKFHTEDIPIAVELANKWQMATPQSFICNNLPVYYPMVKFNYIPECKRSLHWLWQWYVHLGHHTMCHICYVFCSNVNYKASVIDQRWSTVQLLCQRGMWQYSYHHLCACRKLCNLCYNCAEIYYIFICIWHECREQCALGIRW